VVRVRVSVYGAAGFEPLGGVHVIDTSTAGSPRLTAEIDRPVTENQDPTANGTLCDTLKEPTPLFEMESIFDAEDVTGPKAMVEEAAGTDE